MCRRRVAIVLGLASNARGILLFVFLFGGFLPGCVIDPEVSYGYVLLKGDPSQITQWTLAQADHRRIVDGIQSLMYIVVDAHVLPYEKDMAIDGLRQVYAKLLRGWPGNTGLPSYHPNYDSTPPAERQQAGLDGIINVMFRGLAILNPSPRTRALFFKLRPDPGRYPKIYQLWYKSGVEGGLLPPQTPKTQDGAAWRPSGEPDPAGT